MGNKSDSPWRPGERGNALSPAVLIGETLLWDGDSDIRRPQSLAPIEPPCLRSLIAFSSPSLASRETQPLGRLSSPSPSPSDASPLYATLRHKTPASSATLLASLATFLLDSVLLGHGSRDAGDKARGELRWTIQNERQHTGLLLRHPTILIVSPFCQKQVQCVEIVPNFQLRDPLFQHLRLVLQAGRVAQSATERLYAEALTNALAVHFLKRYAAVAHANSTPAYGLPPAKLRCAIAYINEHLDQELSLASIAAVTNTSVAHFARLFRQDTGMTPHQFVIRQRIERARHLLTETDLSFSDIGNQVGFTDQSHFIAVFRKHVGLTPRLYRRKASAMSEER